MNQPASAGMALDVERLLALIPGERPAGRNLREDTGAGALYYRIKDARGIARANERQADAEAERGRAGAEWRTIFDLSQDALESESKDIEVAAWLTEAALRLHGFAGLRDGLRVIEGLLGRYWSAGLHSVAEDSIADRVAPIAGLNGLRADGVLIQPIRLAPLTIMGGFGGAGLWQVAAARRGKPAEAANDLAAAVRESDPATFRAVRDTLQGALDAHAELASRLEALCGEEAPSSSAIRSVLEEAMAALHEIAGPAIAVAPVPAAALAQAGPMEDGEAEDGLTPPRAQNAIASREEALQELLRIAAYFRDAEPHSLLSYGLENLVRRARLPLHDLVRELIPDEAARRAWLTTAGIQAADRPAS